MRCDVYHVSSFLMSTFVVLTSGLQHEQVRYREVPPSCRYRKCASLIRNNLEMVRKRKSDIGYRLVLETTTLNDLEQPNGRYLALLR